MKFEIELPRAGLPIDREVQEVRWDMPREGDWFLATTEGRWCQASFSCSNFKLVATLKPVETWVPATVEDAIEALRGKEIRCRVWDGDSNQKRDCVLTGYLPGVEFPWGTKDCTGFRCIYQHCEVLKVCK